MAGEVVMVTQLLGNSEADFVVFLQQTEKLLTFQKVNQARAYSLRRKLDRFSNYSCAQSEHVTGFGELDNQSPAFAATGGQLDAALAKHENSPWGLTFNKQNSICWIRNSELDGIESPQGRR
jgi:hypothetical protein